jgi:3-deoxy-7-phosphoheptulonate synthase
MNNEFFKNWTTIAGPCSAENREQVLISAKRIKELGGNILRAGIWKPRTSPNTWQGAGDIAIEWMKEAKKETGIAIATEVKTVDNIEKTLLAGFDLLWIGSRNGQNYSLLEEVGKLTSSNKLPIIIKRAMSISLEEWIGSAEYVKRYNSNIILCERGIRGYSPDTRNILDLQTAKLAQNKIDSPVIIDVSHAAGRRDLILPMALASKAAGFNGLMIEVHPNPDNALTDSKQQVSIEAFGDIVKRLDCIPNSNILYGKI